MTKSVYPSCPLMKQSSLQSGAMSDRAALILPGGKGGPNVPLLDYAAWAVVARGGAIHEVEWHDVQQIRGAATAAERIDGVRAQALPVLDAVIAPRPLIIAKSLGTYGVPIAVERGLPAIWITPLLHIPEVCAAMEAATAPFLLVGGTADEMWDGTKARVLTPHVFEVEGADHGMFIDGPLAGCAAILGRVATAVEEFLDNVVWPA